MTAIPSELSAEVDKLERKHAENPDGRYFVPLANAYRKAGETDRAVELLRRGLEKHPDYVSAHIVLGRCLSDVGDLPGAEAEFHQVLNLDPQNLVALRSLGELAAAGGNIDEARRCWGHLLAVDPMNEEARRALDTLPPSGAEEEHARAPDGMDGETVEPAETTLAGSSEGARHARSDSFQDGSVAGEEREAEFADLSSVGREPREVAARTDVGRGYVGGEIVVTETIAELYTRQGFYNRAADVYRELIRRRGGDPRLEERLQHVQRLAEGDEHEERSFEVRREEPIGAAGVVDASDRGSAEREEFGGSSDLRESDAFAESFAGGFPGGAEVAVEDGAAAGSPTQWRTAEEVGGPDTEASDRSGAASGGEHEPASWQTHGGSDAFAESFAEGFPGREGFADGSAGAPAMETGGVGAASDAEGADAWGTDPTEEIDREPSYVGESAEQRGGEELAARSMSAGGAHSAHTIQAYLQTVLAWTPGAGAADLGAGGRDAGAGSFRSADSPAEKGGDALRDGGPAGSTSGEEVPLAAETSSPAPERFEDVASAGTSPQVDEWGRPKAGFEFDDAAAESAAGRFAEDEPRSGHHAGWGEENGTPAGGADTPGSPVPLTFDDDLFPWELPEGASGAGAPTPLVEEAIDMAPPFEPVETPAADAGPPVDRLPSSSGHPPGGEATSADSSPSAEEEDDDDDLESFQAWLRSLKR